MGLLVLYDVCFMIDHMLYHNVMLIAPLFLQKLLAMKTQKDTGRKKV